MTEETSESVSEWEACFCLGSQARLLQHSLPGHREPVHPRMWPCWDLDASQGARARGGGTGLGAPLAWGAADSQPWPSAQQRAAQHLSQAEPTLRSHKQKPCSIVKEKLLF